MTFLAIQDLEPVNTLKLKCFVHPEIAFYGTENQAFKKTSSWERILETLFVRLTCFDKNFCNFRACAFISFDWYAVPVLLLLGGFAVEGVAKFCCFYCAIRTLYMLTHAHTVSLFLRRETEATEGTSVIAAFHHTPTTQNPRSVSSLIHTQNSTPPWCSMYILTEPTIYFFSLLIGQHHYSYSCTVTFYPGMLLTTLSNIFWVSMWMGFLFFNEVCVSVDQAEVWLKCKAPVLWALSLLQLLQSWKKKKKKNLTHTSKVFVGQDNTVCVVLYSDQLGKKKEGTVSAWTSDPVCLWQGLLTHTVHKSQTCHDTDVNKLWPAVRVSCHGSMSMKDDIIMLTRLIKLFLSINEYFCESFITWHQLKCI